MVNEDLRGKAGIFVPPASGDDATARAKRTDDALLIHSGEPLTRFLDDQEYPFKVNPQFKAWVPVTHVPHCWLWVDGVNKPRLWFYSPVDYWHNVAPLPESFWTKDIDVIVLRNADEIGAAVASGARSCGLSWLCAWTCAVSGYCPATYQPETHTGLSALPSGL